MRRQFPKPGDGGGLGRFVYMRAQALEHLDPKGEGFFQAVAVA